MFRTPGYPLLLAPLVRLTGDGLVAVLLARAEAALFGTIAVLGVYYLARLLFDVRSAWIAALMATFYPGAILTSTLVLSEAPFCPLVLLQLILWVLAWRASSSRHRIVLSLIAGLAAGAATLMRPSWLLFTPFAALVGVILARRTDFSPFGNQEVHEVHESHERNQFHSTYQHLSITFWMLLGLVVIMLPWWIRNAYWTGRFIPTTLQTGASLYDGLNPKATGASNMDFVPIFTNRQIAQGSEPPGDPNALFEQKLDRRMHDESLSWAKTNPGRVAELAGIKFLRMWNVWPNEKQWSRWPIRWSIFFTYTPIVIFAIIGACRTFRLGWPYRLCWLPAVYLTMLHVVFVSSLRYREPAMLVLLVLAAGEIGRRVRGSGFRVQDSESRD
jgi:hypothetical protein